jgi:Flp pilus assembly protein TadD
MKLVKKATAVACAGVLAGCVNASSDSAWRLMEDQQQEQAMIQRKEMDDARKKAPEKEQLLIMTIKEAQDQGRYFASLAFIDEYDVKYGKSPEVEILRAEALRKTDQHAQSEEIYRRLTKTRQKAQAWHGLGLMAGQRGDFVEASKNLENASSAAPSDAVILSDLAYARMRMGDIEGARIPIGKAAELMPQNPKVLSNMALYLLVRGVTPAAEQVMQSANLSPQARQQIYALADQIRRLPPAPVQASRSASSREEDNLVRGVDNLRASSAEIKKKQDKVVSASSYRQAQNSQQQSFDLQLPASAPLPADIQPRPDAQPQARIQPEPEPQLVNVGQQQAQASESVRTAPREEPQSQPRQQLVRGNEAPLQMAPPSNDPIAMMQPAFVWPPVSQQQAEEKRLAELAKQQAEEKRLAEVAQQAEEKRLAELAKQQAEEKRLAEVAQQAEEKRLAELAKQQAEEKRQAEVAQQQAEEKRQAELAQAKQKEQQLVRGNEAPPPMAAPSNDPIAMMQPAFVWQPVSQQQAEEKRLAELAKQQAEEKRLAELAQQQAEEKRLAEVAQQQAEEKRLAELAQQQAEEKRLAEVAQQQQAEEKRLAEVAQQQAEEKRLAEVAQQQAEEKRLAEVAQQQAEEKRLAAKAQAASDKAPSKALSQAIPTSKSKAQSSAIDRSILDEVSIVGGDFILKRK